MPCIINKVPPCSVGVLCWLIHRSHSDRLAGGLTVPSTFIAINTLERRSNGCGGLMGGRYSILRMERMGGGDSRGRGWLTPYSFANKIDPPPTDPPTSPYRVGGTAGLERRQSDWGRGAGPSARPRASPGPNPRGRLRLPTTFTSPAACGGREKRAIESPGQPRRLKQASA